MFFRVRTLALALALVIGIATTASATSISYTVNVGGGSISGNPITHLAIYETNGTSSSIDFGFSLNPTGATTLTHNVGFVPTSSLLLGLDVPTEIDGKTHLYFFTNPEFAFGANGVKFSVVFPHTRYPEVAVNLLGAEGGNDTNLLWLQNFFAGDGTAAAFATGGANWGIEFSGGVIATPEPSTFVLFGLGAAMAAALRLRAKR